MSQTSPMSGERTPRTTNLSEFKSERSTTVARGAQILARLFKARSMRRKGEAESGMDGDDHETDVFETSQSSRKTRTMKKKGAKGKPVSEVEAEEEQRQRELQEYLNVSERGYLPVHVRTKLLDLNGVPSTPHEEGSRGVVLFADISGFTNLGKELRTKMSALEAASKLANRICIVLRELTDICHDFEGDVSKFAGDALLCLWENHEDQWMLERAKACAVRMLNKIKELDSQLDLHGGIAMGNILHLHLGDHKQELLWYLVTGDAVVRAANLVDSAPRGMILYEPRKDSIEETQSRNKIEEGSNNADEGSIAPSIKPPLNRLPSTLDCVKLTKDTKTMIVPVVRRRKSLAEDERPLDSPGDPLGQGRRLSSQDDELQVTAGDARGMATRTRTSTEDDPFLNMRITPRGRSYIPRALKNILMSGRIESGEMRTGVVILFAALPSLVLSEDEIVKNKVDPDRKSLLNDTIAHMSAIIRQTDGAFRDLLFDDKGCIFIAVFGAYNAVEMPELKALKAARRMEEELEVDDLKIGLSVGTCFVGLVGNDVRHDMIVMGHEVNMAARYMAKAREGSILVSSKFKQATEEFFDFQPVRVDLQKNSMPGNLPKPMTARRFDSHENDLVGDVDGPAEVRRGSEFTVNDPNGTVLAFRPAKERQRRGSEITSSRYLAIIPDDCFVGRKAELSKLQTHFTKAAGTNKVPSFCMVAGPRGYGKSWLLREYRHRIDEKFASAMGVAFELNILTPLYVFKQIFERIFEVADGLPEKQAKKVLSHWSNAGVKPDVSVLGKLFPHLVKIANPPPRRLSTMPGSGMFSRLMGSMRFSQGQLQLDPSETIPEGKQPPVGAIQESMSSGASATLPANTMVEEIRSASSSAQPSGARTPILSGSSPKLEPVGKRGFMSSIKDSLGERKGSSRGMLDISRDQSGTFSLSGAPVSGSVAVPPSSAGNPVPPAATNPTETMKQRLARKASRPEMNLVMGAKEFEPVFKFISGLLELASNDAIKAGKKGLLIILEDVQWMDAVSLQVMVDLVDKMMANPKGFLPNVHFMASCRNADPDKPDEEYYSSGQGDIRPILEQRFLEKVQVCKNFQLVELDVLSRDEVNTLLGKILVKGNGDTVSDEVQSLVYNNTGGMPNAVADIIALIRQNEAIYLEPHSNQWKWRPAGKNDEGGQRVLREARQAFILRIDDLSLAARDLIKIAACVSEDKHKFSLYDISDVIRLDLENKSRYLRADTHVPSVQYIASKLQEAISAGLLKFRKASIFNPLDEWAFASYAICESVLDMVPTDRLNQIREMKRDIEKEKSGQAAEGIYRDFFGGV